MTEIQICKICLIMSTLTQPSDTPICDKLCADAQRKGLTDDRDIVRMVYSGLGVELFNKGSSVYKARALLYGPLESEIFNPCAPFHVRIGVLKRIECEVTQSH